MKLTDKAVFKGEFSITAYKKDGTIETYSDNNLIMDKARSNMAKLIGGQIDEGLPINQFVLGNKGHINANAKGSNILEYKLVGSNGFIAAKDKLFSEDVNNDIEGVDSIANFSYSIPFNTENRELEYIDTNALGRINTRGKSISPSSVTHVCEVKRTIVDRTCTFVITIPDYAGNLDSGSSGVGGSGVMAYTEAALYSGNDIFSMKTFPARVKEETVKFIITWSIIF